MQRTVLIHHDIGLFIAGPAIIKGLVDDLGQGLLFGRIPGGYQPQSEVLQDLADHGRLGDETDDPHLSAAVGARQRIDLVDLPDTIPSSLTVTHKLLLLAFQHLLVSVHEP
jgi:hypothetical protein